MKALNKELYIAMYTYLPQTEQYTMSTNRTCLILPNVYQAVVSVSNFSVCAVCTGATEWGGGGRGFGLKWGWREVHPVIDLVGLLVNE